MVDLPAPPPGRSFALLVGQMPGLGPSSWKPQWWRVDGLRNGWWFRLPIYSISNQSMLMGFTCVYKPANTTEMFMDWNFFDQEMDCDNKQYTCFCATSNKLDGTAKHIGWLNGWRVVRLLHNHIIPIRNPLTTHQPPGLLGFAQMVLVLSKWDTSWIHQIGNVCDGKPETKDSQTARILHEVWECPETSQCPFRY